MKYWYVIPARSGSKGLPGKNRILFSHTAEKVPKKIRSRVIVSTDDPEIIEKSKEYSFKVHKRSAQNASDTASTRDVLVEVAKNFEIPPDDKIVLLYLTYPGRKWSDIVRAKKLFTSHNSTSLLCKKEVVQTPYLMFYERPGMTGSKVIEHDLCRRQDYEKCFMVSHYIGIFSVKDLPTLDTNLWRHDTIFMKINDEVDVDYREDLNTFLIGKENERKSNS